MIGQSFAPLGSNTRPQPGGPGGAGGVQEAIQVLNMRMPRVQGAGAPAPQALLQGAGSAGLPQQSLNPVIQAILQAVLGRFSPQSQVAPSAQGGMVPGGGMPQSLSQPIAGGNLQPTGQPGGFQSPGLQPSFQMPTPKVNYMPNPKVNYQEPGLPGGTAGPGPGRGPTAERREDLPRPMTPRAAARWT